MLSGASEIKDHAYCVAAPTSETNFKESRASIVNVSENVDPRYTTETGTSLNRNLFVVCLDARHTLCIIMLTINLHVHQNG